MTTIAWDGETLAADSQMTSSNYIPAGQVAKAWRTKDGFLWAHAGCAHDIERLKEWSWSDRSTTPHKLEEGGLICIDPSGNVRQWWADGWISTRGKPLAWGSGERIAMGALLAGASAARAVEIAATLDSDTGGEIVAVSIGKPS